MCRPIPRRIEFSRNRTLARKIAALLPRNYSLVLPYSFSLSLSSPPPATRSLSIYLVPLFFFFFFLIKHRVHPRSLYASRRELYAAPRRAAEKSFSKTGLLQH